MQQILVKASAEKINLLIAYADNIDVIGRTIRNVVEKESEKVDQAFRPVVWFRSRNMGYWFVKIASMQNKSVAVQLLLEMKVGSDLEINSDPIC